MSQSHPRPRARAADERTPSGSRLAVMGALVVVALIVVPWVTTRLTTSPVAPALVTFVALAAALYAWFRSAQRVHARTAAIMSVVYAAIAAGVIWAWVRM